MPMTIALLSPGAMGSAIAARLVAHRAVVLTSLAGRGSASVARAQAAGMIDAAPERLAEAELILSIVPPGEAVALAERLAPAIAAAARKPVYIDCNAINPDSKRHVERIVGAAGAATVDGAIIGLPPEPGSIGPTLYVAGSAKRAAAVLADLGIRVRPIDGAIGAAAALKMAYAGLNKGTTGLGAAMMLAASRASAAAALRDELAESLPAPLASLSRAVPNMYPKAYRWVAEMREIAAFARDDEATAMIFEGFARLFERLAADGAGDAREIAMLDAFLGR